MNAAIPRAIVPAILLAALPALAAALQVDVNSTNPVPPYTNWATAANDDPHYSTFDFSRPLPMPAVGASSVTNAPLFTNTNDWPNLRLQSNSPSSDAGGNLHVTTTTDLDGRPRIVEEIVDMGAYEYQGPGTNEFIVWLQQYGLPTDGSVDDQDGDSDKATAWQEWKAWTNPTNALSVLRMLSPQPGTNGTLVPWQSISGHNYTLERAMNGAPAFTTLQSGIFGQADTTTFTDTTATNGEVFLYRVGVSAE